MQVWGLRDVSLPSGAAGADAVERLRVRRAFEAALPPLADVRRHPLRCGFMIELDYEYLGSLRHIRVIPAVGSVPSYCQGAPALRSALARNVLSLAEDAFTITLRGPAAEQRNAARHSNTHYCCAASRQRLQAAWEAAEWEERAAALERRDEARLAAAQAALARRLLAVRARGAMLVLRHTDAAPPRDGARPDTRSRTAWNPAASTGAVGGPGITLRSRHICAPLM